MPHAAPWPSAPRHARKSPAIDRRVFRGLDAGGATGGVLVRAWPIGAALGDFPRLRGSAIVLKNISARVVTRSRVRQAGMVTTPMVYRHPRPQNTRVSDGGLCGLLAMST